MQSETGMSLPLKLAIVAVLVGIPFVRRYLVPQTIATSADVVTVLDELDDGLADESSCVECHDQATEFFETGHARTLHRASDNHSLKLLQYLKSTAAVLEGGISLQVKEGQPFVVNSDGETESFPT